MAIEQDPRLLQWGGACPVWDWHVALAVEMKMKAMLTVNSRHNSYLRFRDSSHLSSLAAVLLVTVKVCQQSYFHFYYETRTRLPGEQMGKQWYYNGICQIILHMRLSLKILTHSHAHTLIYVYKYLHIYMSIMATPTKRRYDGHFLLQEDMSCFNKSIRLSLRMWFNKQRQRDQDNRLSSSAV